MRIIAKRTLRAYWDGEPRAEQPLKAWYAIARKADWSCPSDVKAVYGHASIIGNDRVVFNIGGNRYRLIIRFDYPRRIGFVRFVGTHAEYDRIDASQAQEELKMTIKPIRDETDYDPALAEIDRLMGVAAGTPESDRLEVLVTLVERYESAHWSIDAPDPISAIHHVMEARGLRNKDLAALIGSQSHASEVLRRRRPLSLAMIRVLATEWSLPAEVLVREYELATT